ncbi:hypothetical protein ACH4D5_05840 [Streptomyces sp. NPDC018029]
MSICSPGGYASGCSGRLQVELEVLDVREPGIAAGDVVEEASAQWL